MELMLDLLKVHRALNEIVVVVLANLLATSCTVELHAFLKLFKSVTFLKVSGCGPSGREVAYETKYLQFYCINWFQITCLFSANLIVLKRPKDIKCDLSDSTTLEVCSMKFKGGLLWSKSYGIKLSESIWKPWVMLIFMPLTKDCEVLKNLYYSEDITIRLFNFSTSILFLLQFLFNNY